MKKILLLMLIVANVTMAVAQSLSVGLRQSDHVWVRYELKQPIGFALEHSVYSEKFGYQYVRGYVDCGFSVCGIDCRTAVYGGATYNRNYWNSGIRGTASYNKYRYFRPSLTLNPNYDSFFKSKLCYEIELQSNVYRELSLVAAFSTIPQYRQSEKCVNVGLSIDCKRLKVKPLLSLPTESIRDLRVLMSFGYCLW